MKLNPRHHNTKLLEQIDEYYFYDHNHYDSCYYDSMWGENSTCSSEEDWIEYHWLNTLDRVTTIHESISYIDGCSVYKEYDIILDYEIYSYSSTNKTVGFFGAILKAQKETKHPSVKLNKICNIMADRYPEIFIRLIDVI
jgi:hypothetical protein